MMKMNTWKKVVAGVVMSSMVASVASADTGWRGTGVSANWNIAENWSSGALPGADEKTQFSSSYETECLIDTSVVAGQLVMGDNGDATKSVTVRIASGGTLTSGILDTDSWSAVSYNRPTHCIVEAGGTFNTLARLGVGLNAEGDGLLEVYGDVSVIGTFQVADGDARKGRVNVFDGGTISATSLSMAGDDGQIDLWQGATLTLDGDRTNAVAGFIAEGKILGNRMVSNLTNEVEIDAGVTNTVVAAVENSIPNLAGLTTNEAADVLAVFGYTVGTTMEGTAPGGITGHVAAQVPAAGTTNFVGSSVDLIIQEAGEVPDVVGLDYVAASNLIFQSGYVIGVETETYVFDATPGLVTGQSPAGGTEANPGDPVSIDFYERLAPSATIEANLFGDWMNSGIWSTGVVPERETQNFEVRIRGDVTVTLTNKVAIKKFRAGINGYEDGPFQLDIGDGGHLVAAQLSGGDFASIGDNAQGGVNVYSNGVFESRETIRLAWGAGDGQDGLSTLNIDGGKVISANWMSFGRNDGSTRSEVTIKNGGSLEILRFRNDMTNGVITISEGTFKMFGTSRVGDLQDGLDAGTIVIADGYSYSLSNESGDSVITGYLPGYDSWAKKYGLAAGSENEDPDADLADNLWEYGVNGNPTNSANVGVDPVFLDEDGVLEYVHLMRADDTNLVYDVVTTDDLVNGVWTPSGSAVVGTEITGEDYDVVTNSISTAMDKAFIRLNISNP